jgi:hypothetical protein
MVKNTYSRSAPRPGIPWEKAHAQIQIQQGSRASARRTAGFRCEPRLDAIGLTPHTRATGAGASPPRRTRAPRPPPPRRLRP